MTAKLGAALVAAQKDMPTVDKTGKSNFGAHVTLDHLIAKTRPHLAKHGLAITQFIDHTELGQPALRTTLMHDSGESLSSLMPLLLTKQDMQQLGSATTYARRYSWGAIIGITTETDDDADSIASWSQPAAAESGQGERPRAAAVETQGATPAAAPPSGGFTFPSGKHAGKTLGEVDASYLTWYIANGPREDVKEAIRAYSGGITPGTHSPADPHDDGIPFDRTSF